MSDRIRVLALSTTSLTLALALLGGPAWAQSAQGTGASIAAAVATPAPSSTVQEIVVTARLRAENLKDVPETVSVLSASTLQAAGVSRADNIVALTPGVSLVSGAAEQGDIQVNIRGVNSARDADPSFAFVLDGIQIANPAAFNREFTDLRQIEVVKGPQGAIYGRNAEAGAVIVTTEKPSDHVTGLIDGSAGNYGAYAAKFRVSGPITDFVSGTIAGDYRHTDGQYRNHLFTGQQALDAFKGGNINGRLYFRFGEKTTLDVKARYGQLDAGAIDYNAVFALPAFAGATGNNAFYEDANGHHYVFQNDVEHDNRQRAGEISAKLDHDFGFARLTAWGLYSDIRNDLIADGTSAAFGFFNTDKSCLNSTAQLSAQGVTLPAPQSLAPTPATSFFGPYTPTACDGYQYQKRDQQDASFEVRLTSPSNQRFRWLAGAYYLHVDRTVGVSTGVDSGGRPPTALIVPAPAAYSTEQLLYDNFTSDVGAVFGQAQYDILNSVEGSVALRYDSESRSVHNLVPTNLRSTYIDYNGPPYTGGAALNPGLDPTLNPSGISDRSKTYSQLQPKVGLRWTLSPALTVYGNWGIGFKSGGFNNQGSQATINAFINPVRTAAGFTPVNIQDDYRKETSSQFELGAKARLFDGRLTLDGAIFDNTVDNMQFFEFFVGPFGLLRVVSNIDRVKLDGAELGARFKATRYLSLEASGAYTYSRIERNAVRPDTVGNRSPYTPEYTWNLAAQYDRPLPNDFKLQARLDVRGVGSTWFHVVQNQPNPTVFELSFGALGRADFTKTERDPYQTVDLRIGVERHGLSLTLFGQNIFDERYLAEVIPAPEFGGAFVSPADGARYGVEVGYRF